jgi:hypothetical protein
MRESAENARTEMREIMGREDFESSFESSTQAQNDAPPPPISLPLSANLIIWTHLPIETSEDPFSPSSPSSQESPLPPSSTSLC